MLKTSKHALVFFMAIGLAVWAYGNVGPLDGERGKLVTAIVYTSNDTMQLNVLARSSLQGSVLEIRDRHMEADSWHHDFYIHHAELLYISIIAYVFVDSPGDYGTVRCRITADAKTVIDSGSVAVRRGGRNAVATCRETIH